MSLNDNDIQEFFSIPANIKRDYLQCEYLFETLTDPKMAAASFCQELSTAQWKRPGVDEDLRPKFAAKVIDLKIISKQNLNNATVTKCDIKIAYPLIHLQNSIPVLLSALAGEGAFYCPDTTTVRLIDIHFPKPWLDSFDGPQFGLEGMRKLLNVNDRPFFVGVVKPNLGLSPTDFAKIAHEAWSGGLDIAKDDEMLMNPPYSPLKERMQACSHFAQRTMHNNSKHMIVANITDEVDEIRYRYLEATTSGANAVMINPHFTGLSVIRSVRKYSQVPLWGHFTGQALFDRIPGYGIEAKVLIKLQRLAGCDVIVMPGFGPRMKCSDQDVLSNLNACLEPMGQIKPCLPIPGGSDWAGTLPYIYEKIGHENFGLIAGRGVFSHPNGAKAGAKSLHDAWQAIQMGIPPSDWSTVSDELAQALKTFGGQTK